MSFIWRMKDNLGLWRLYFVLHGADERHLGSVMSLICPSLGE
ncbi:hypothetical protein HMPREF3213_02766 [Heyndrickxia coagulans]|uniref:Uncharacterized protein n=1 Tax=Heyndrickxia coagulans TaxID=1398 RepID=A0A133KIY2_HEYCO|nr:hypothetical protein HMPREF3213_02766 [Heyndrickxia coagulans]